MASLQHLVTSNTINYCIPSHPLSVNEASLASNIIHAPLKNNVTVALILFFFIIKYLHSWRQNMMDGQMVKLWCNLGAGGVMIEMV